MQEVTYQFLDWKQSTMTEDYHGFPHSSQIPDRRVSKIGKPSQFRYVVKTSERFLTLPEVKMAL
jgi:hypothetical protein